MVPSWATAAALKGQLNCHLHSRGFTSASKSKGSRCCATTSSGDTVARYSGRSSSTMTC